MAESAFSGVRAAVLCRRLLPYAVRRWPALLAVAATMLLETAANLLKPWPMALVVDSVVGTRALPSAVAAVFEALPGGTSREDLLTWAVLATLAVFLLGWALSAAARLAGVAFGEQMQYDLAADLLRHLQRLSLRFHSWRGAGDLLRRLTVDTGCVSTVVKDALLPAVASAVSLVAMLLVMLRLDAELTLLALAVVPVLVAGLHRFSAPMAERDYEQQEAEGRVYEVVEETLSGIATVQACGGEAAGERRFRGATDSVLRATLRATAVQYRFRAWVGSATAVGTALVLWVGGRHALAGELSTGELLVLLAYLGGLYGPLEALVYSSSTVQGALGSASRVMEVLDTEPDVVDGPGALEGRAAGHLRLEDVVFGYEPGTPVLHGVSLEARPGELVALVGTTGAGKSTIANLVCRSFDPDSGRVLLDGHDLRALRVRDVRAQVAVVLQESFLFPVSVADNIAYGRPGASREEVVAAARAAGAAEFVERLPQGYDTVVGERGGTLSGGQRQRIAIARALLKDAPVLVLDEPTSALDARTESALLAALDVLTAGRTTLVIAHRLSTVRRADRIVVLDQGRVAETGTHEELLARRGLYARMDGLQSHGRDEVPLAWAAP